jgi:hypothetical protein
MTKNFDDYAEDEDLPIKVVSRCRIIDHEVPGLLVMLMEYFDSIDDEEAGKVSAINLAISVDAAEMLGAALINSAKNSRKVPETKH